MGKINIPQLTDEQRQSLEKGFRQGLSHCFRMRCQSILLKSEGRTSREVGQITGMSLVTVNSWLYRFQKEGIAGLETKSGRGRKPVIDLETEKKAIMEAIKANRNSMMAAKAEWERKSGKSVCRNTFAAIFKELIKNL